MRCKPCSSANLAVLLCMVCLLCLKFSTAHVKGPKLDPAKNKEMQAKIHAGYKPKPKRVFLENTTRTEKDSALPRGRGLAVCGVDDAYRSNYKTACKLTMYSRNGDVYYCSAWVITQQHVATAGHCLFDPTGHWFVATDVYCGGIEVGPTTPPTRRAIRVVTTDPFYNFAYHKSIKTSMWADAGVIKLNAPLDESYTVHPYGERTGCTGATNALLSGYPATTEGKCPSGFTGKVQWSAQGRLSCKTNSDGFLNSNLDACKGQSGSRVMHNGKVVGIFVAEVQGQGVCMNYVTRIKDGGDGRGPGVYMRKLIDALS